MTLAWVFCLGLVACAQSQSQPGPDEALHTSPASPTESTQGKQSKPEQKTASATLTRVPSLKPTRTAPPAPAHQPSPTATRLACWQAGGRWELDSLPDTRLKLPLEFSVYLPPCYDQQPDRRYPVLYMIHGQNYNQDQWDRLGIDETADSLIASGEIQPFLIVLPRDRSWDQPNVDPFGQVLVEALVPWIDVHYRTLPDRLHRSVGGLSRGAGWAIHLGLSHWDLFGAIGGHSPPVFWADTSHIRTWLDAIPRDSLPRIYLDIGEKDRPSIMDSAVWFEGLLTEKSIPHVWHLYSGYHEEAYWAAHVEEYLRWYAAEWK